MKLTLSWLKQHLDTNASLTEVCDKLTSIGLEVEGIEDQSASLAPFTIAQIITAEKHPQADKLQVCSVNTGTEKLQIVCGAPNARAGLKTVLAHTGDIIPKTGEALKKGVIRGVESQGMMCSAAELELSDEAKGIIELPTDAPVGANYADYAKLCDPVIDVNLTPNRGDCAGVLGIARDLAAAGLGKLKPIDVKMHKGTEASRIKVALDFPTDKKADCPLFIGRMIRNVKNKPSPEWLQRYLRAVGARPISALVDITNYLTLDCNRPLHIFDADKVKGDLRVHPAKGGETLETLNGKSYTLEEGMTVISDDTGVLSLAGVIGGASTGCQDGTTNVFIEAALFDPTRVAHTGRALQINSDARYRFERGVDSAFVLTGAELATQLVLDFCGTSETVVSDLYIAGQVPACERKITYAPVLCLKRIGVDVPDAEQRDILQRLGFKIDKVGSQWEVTIPSWRPDIIEGADITEEVIRMKGYDAIPSVSIERTEVITPSALDIEDRRAGQMRRALATQGLMESVTWSFMPGALAEKFGAIDPSLRLVNPISADLDVMRPSVFGHLMLAAKRNTDRGYGDIGLFEIGPVFGKNFPEGQTTVATVLRAGHTPRHWAEPSRAFDVFDVKADALAALTVAGAPMASIQVFAEAPSWYHPGRSGALRLGPVLLGYFGELHPALVAEIGLEGAVVGCELFLSAIPQPRSTSAARPLLKLEELQPLTRDFAFVVGRDVAVEKMIKAIKSADKTLVRDVTVFDVYEGDRIDADKKSVALGVTLQPIDHTLTDAELEDISTQIVAAVTKVTDAVLR